MKTYILSYFILLVSLFSLTSCLTMEDVAYQDEYVVGTTSYPVYYINSYPYYWFDNTWIMIPRYHYIYIRHIDSPRYIHAYRPRPHEYYRNPNYGHHPRPIHPRNHDPRPHNPNVGNHPHNNHGNHSGGIHNNHGNGPRGGSGNHGGHGNGHGRFGGRR